MPLGHPESGLPGGDGRVVITDQIFPKPSSDGLSLFANGGIARLVSLHIWQLRSICGTNRDYGDAFGGWHAF